MTRPPAPHIDASTPVLVLGGRQGALGVARLLPATDALAIVGAEHADALTGPFVFPRLSPHLVFSLLSKREMFYLATRIGIPTARTAFPRSEDEVPRLLDTVPLPIVVKGIDPRLPGGKGEAIGRS